MSKQKPPRPDPLGIEHSGVPETLRNTEQWVCWKYEYKTGREEWTKIPINAKKTYVDYAKATDESTWSDFDTALARATDGKSGIDGIGYVFSPQDMCVGVDLDDVRDPQTGEFEDWAEELLEETHTYAEVSPSGTGLHLFGLGVLPEGGNRGSLSDKTGHIEMYDSGRYFTVTGHTVGEQTDVRQVPQQISEIHSEYVAEPEEANPSNSGDNPGLDRQTEDKNPGSKAGGSTSSELSDDELLQKAKNADNGEKFTALWEGNISGLNYKSHSEADMALCYLLAFWTGGSHTDVDRLFRKSHLYRDKWDNDRGEQTYGDLTISNAISSTSDYYEPGSGSGSSESQSEGEPSPQEDSQEIYDLTPSLVSAWAGLGEGEDVDELDDRQRAACVWELLQQTDKYHVRVRRDNATLWSYDNGIWTNTGERALRHAGREALGSMNYGANVLAELKAQARSDPRAEVEPSEFGVSPGTIATETGLVYLQAAAEGGKYTALRDLKPEDYALNRLPVEYDPEASYDEWAEYVEEWAEDGYAKALQEYVGYTLHVGALPIHRALLLVGSGANGKGTFLSVVRSLLGDDNTSSTELQTLANERDAVADFYGSLANIDDDLSSRKLGQGLGMFKKLVAGDRVRARRLYQDGFEFDATGKHLYAANEVPDIDVSDDDEAFWRRWLLVEFPNHYAAEDRDPGLRNELQEPDSLSGVLNWAIKGWARLIENDYFTGEQQLAHEKRSRWQMWGDSVDKFTTSCVERDPEADNISTGDVHRVYTEWCRENGERPGSQQKLTSTLKNEELDYARSVRTSRHSNPTRGYKSLGLTEEAPDLKDTPERESMAGDSEQQSL